MTDYLWPNGSRDRPPVSSRFNPNRRHPVTRLLTPHRGDDLVGFSSVLAAAEGEVIGAGRLAGWFAGGIQAVIQHPDGYVTRYMHLASIAVRNGQRVTRGQKLGVMGKTGVVTGVHLHFEVRTGRGVALDPSAFIPANLPPLGGTGTVKPPPKPASHPVTNPAPVAPTIPGDEDMDPLVIALGNKVGIYGAGWNHSFPSRDSYTAWKGVYEQQTKRELPEPLSVTPFTFKAISRAAG